MNVNEICALGFYAAYSVQLYWIQLYWIQFAIINNIYDCYQRCSKLCWDCIYECYECITIIFVKCKPSDLNVIKISNSFKYLGSVMKVLSTFNIYIYTIYIYNPSTTYCKAGNNYEYY